MTLTDRIQITENQKRLAEVLIHTYKQQGDSQSVATQKAFKRLSQRYHLDCRDRAC